MVLGDTKNVDTFNPSIFKSEDVRVKFQPKRKAI